METEKTTYLIKLGELTLKGGNRKEFEQKLIYNSKKLLEGTKAIVNMRYGRFFIEGAKSQEPHMEWALNHLVGITGWAKAHVVTKNLDEIQKVVIEEAEKAKAKGYKTFKCESRRSDKSFELDSYALSRMMGSGVFDAGILQVDVHKPDIVICIEVREKNAFVYSNQIKANRGLPVGTSGKGLLLLSGGIDSPVAGYKMLCRGMKLDCLYFHSWPYTSEEAQKKVEDLATVLANYGLGLCLNIVPFTEVQKIIKANSPEEYSTLLLRMCMMKTANILAKFIGSQCIITGESLGQVASQTIENMTVTESCAELPVLRPLVGLDKEDIIKTAQTINTYETSILPYEDCCVLFSPKHPILRANVKEAQEIYKNLNIDQAIQEAFDKREIKKILSNFGNI